LHFKGHSRDGREQGPKGDVAKRVSGAEKEDIARPIRSEAPALATW
jgi:hypothetical protein